MNQPGERVAPASKALSMIAIFLVALLPVPVTVDVVGAEIIEGTADVSAYSGILETEHDRSAFLFGLRFAFHFTESRTIEGSFGVAFPESSKVYHALLNYRFNYTTGLETLVLTFAGGGGVSHISFDEEQGESSTDPMFDFGGGLLYFASDYVGLRIDVRDNLILRDDRVIDLLEVTGGIGYFFY